MGLRFFSYLCAEIETKNFINIWKGVNDMIQRQLQDVIESRMFAGKAIILIGARQVGKSTLFKMILEKHDEPTLF